MPSLTRSACECLIFRSRPIECWRLWTSSREANKMRAFEYASPDTEEQAAALLGSSWADAEVLAGGTDLLSLMKDDIVHPKRLVNIKGIPELRAIKASKTGLSIGATVTIQELLDNAQVRREYQALVQAAEGITSPQIRGM